MLARVSDPSERRLIERAFLPIKRHHDLAEARAAVQAATEAPRPGSSWSSQLKATAVKALAAHVAEALPELRDHEVRARAEERLGTVWASMDEAHDGQVAAALHRLAAVEAGDLPLAHELVSHSFQDGAERARAQHQAAPASPFEGISNPLGIAG